MSEPADLQAELADLRHDLHRHPEVGLDLPHTQGRVLEALDGLDLELATGTTCTSVTAVLRGGAADLPDTARPTVLLRADMDALPLTEEVDTPWRSTVDGAMHACGHDLHTAMLVGAARLLAARRETLPGDVVFMFQPGEEGHDGAARMIAEGVLDAAGRRPEAAWALHVMSARLPRGVVASRPGPLLAAAGEVHVTVRGAGGHGSAPERARDPVPVAATMVTGLQTLLSRIVSPFEPVVLTVGEFHAGTRANIIPDTARFAATMRSFDDDLMHDLERAVTDYVHGTAAAHGLTAEVDFTGQYPVTVNDDDAIETARAVVDRVLGPVPTTDDDRDETGPAQPEGGDTEGHPDDVHRDQGTPDGGHRDAEGSAAAAAPASRWLELPTPMAGAEDFSRVLQEVPGAMLFLGACLPDRDPESAPDNHSPLSAFDDAVLADGATLLTALATTSLQPPDQPDPTHQV